MKSFIKLSILSVALMASVQNVTFANDITLSENHYTVTKSINNFYDFILIKTNNGRPIIVSEDEMVKDLANYNIVFMGEAHGHVASHLVQSKVFSGLYQYTQNLTLSMEQFERSQQHIVDDYLSGKIGEEKLFHEGKAWEHYRSSYRPLVEFAKAKSLPVIASEVPAEMVSCVGEEGPDFLKRISGEPRTWIAEKLHLEDGAYKTKYLSFLKGAAGHSVGGKDMSDEEKEKITSYRFAAQVSRDDTMAESIARHLKANPGRTVVHINGSFHSAGLLGTPERVLKHIPGIKMANVHTVLVKDANNPSFKASDLKEGQYLLLVQNIPKRFRGMKEINAFVKRTKSAIDKKKCNL